MLLDTHIWIWWLIGGGKLSLAERKAINAAAQRDPPKISAISLWEAQMLHSRGRLALQVPFASWLVRATLPEVALASRDSRIRKSHLVRIWKPEPAS